MSDEDEIKGEPADPIHDERELDLIAAVQRAHYTGGFERNVVVFLPMAFSCPDRFTPEHRWTFGYYEDRAVYTARRRWPVYADPSGIREDPFVFLQPEEVKAAAMGYTLAGLREEAEQIARTLKRWRIAVSKGDSETEGAALVALWKRAGQLYQPVFGFGVGDVAAQIRDVAPHTHALLFRRLLNVEMPEGVVWPYADAENVSRRADAGASLKKLVTGSKAEAEAFLDLFTVPEIGDFAPDLAEDSDDDGDDDSENDGGEDSVDPPDAEDAAEDNEEPE